MPGTATLGNCNWLQILTPEIGTKVENSEYIEEYIAVVEQDYQI